MAKTRNQALVESLALAYTSGSTIKAWAEANKIPVNTCYEWTKGADFKRLVAEHRSRLIGSALNELLKGSSGAAAQIVKLAESAENEAVKLSACKAVLDHLISLSNFEDLRQRVDALKAEIEAMKEGGRLGIQLLESA